MDYQITLSAPELDGVLNALAEVGPWKAIHPLIATLMAQRQQQDEAARVKETA